MLPMLPVPKPPIWLMASFDHKKKLVSKCRSMTWPTGRPPKDLTMEKNRVICSNPLITLEKSIMEDFGHLQKLQKKVQITSGKIWTLAGKTLILEKTETGEFLSKLDCLRFFPQNSVGDYVYQIINWIVHVCSNLMELNGLEWIIHKFKTRMNISVHQMDIQWFIIGHSSFNHDHFISCRCRDMKSQNHHYPSLSP